MLRKKQFCFIAFILVFALLGFHEEASAEQVQKSVKDCFEQPEACGDQPNTKQNMQTDGSVTKQTDANSTVGLTIWDFIKMILATIFVVALLYFILKFINKKNRLFQSSQLIENLGGTTLGANRSVQLIKIGNRILVVGVGENIHLIKEIDDSKEFEELLSTYNNKMDQLTQSGDILSKLFNKAVGNSEKKDESSSFQSQLQKQLVDFSKGRQKLYDELEKEKGSDKQ